MKTGLGVAIIALAGIISVGGVVLIRSTRPPPAAPTYVPDEIVNAAYTFTPAMDLAAIKKITPPEEDAAPAGPPPAFSTRMPITALLANSAAQAVVFQDIPALAQVSQAQLDMAGPMSLRVVQSMLPAILTNAALDKLDQDLAKVPAPPANAAAPVTTTVAAVPAAAPPATPAVAAVAGPQPAFSTRTTLSVLLANPAARAIVMREVPMLSQAPQAQIDMAAAMSLRDVQRLMPAAVTDAALQRLDQSLAALPAGASPAAPGA